MHKQHNTDAVKTLAKLIQEKKAKPNLWDDQEAKDALILAACNQAPDKLDPELILALINLGAEHHDWQSVFSLAVSQNYTEAVKALLASGRVNPNIKDNFGWTPFFVAAAMGHTEAVNALLASERVDPNLQDDDGVTPMLAAAANGHTETLNALLASEIVDPNLQDNDGWTPLDTALKNRRWDIASNLIARGADVNIYNVMQIRSMNVAQIYAKQHPITTSLAFVACTALTYALLRNIPAIANLESFAIKACSKLLESASQSMSQALNSTL